MSVFLFSVHRPPELLHVSFEYIWHKSQSIMMDYFVADCLYKHNIHVLVKLSPDDWSESAVSRDSWLGDQSAVSRHSCLGAALTQSAVDWQEDEWNKDPISQETLAISGGRTPLHIACARDDNYKVWRQRCIIIMTSSSSVYFISLCLNIHVVEIVFVPESRVVVICDVSIVVLMYLKPKYNLPTECL